jgi:hypothetical protein
MIVNRSADARHRIGLEFDVLFRVEFFDRVEQPEIPVANKVAIFDHRWQSDRDFPGYIFYERTVPQDEFITDMDVCSAAVEFPQSIFF